ncbi:MAG TPA: S-methyl-5'-thioadenosine phosphorylase [Aggregatilineales bacterium]|nr:S-methyl-5'-thioadenosine phosphorylase [Aggregatilineales bacterium]
MDSVQIGVIGGSGLYHMPDFVESAEYRIETPFGPTSDAIVVGKLRGIQVAFVPRHGRGHVLSPSEVPYRANIYALKTLGVSSVIAVSACGSLKEDFKPGHIVIPDQLTDYTKADRGRSFFGGGIVAHVGVADPFCPALRQIAVDACRAAGATVHADGTFVTIEGPRFSTRGESRVWRQLGFGIIGMTTSPEAFLAREAEMHYTVMAHVTDYDVWHDEPVSADAVFKQFNANIALAQRAVAEAVERIGTRLAQSSGFECGCESALAVAFATGKEAVTPQARVRLKSIVGKYYQD